MLRTRTPIRGADALRAVAAALVLATASVASAGEPSAFERGLARFQAGDFAGAIAPLAAAHRADPTDPEAALLLGIAYYRTGDPERARPLLEQAERSTDAEDQASARVFLGLIAESGGDSDRAERYYRLVARSPTELGVSGRLLLGRDGPERWALALIARPGYDSNVGLLPATAATPGPVPPGPGRGHGSLGDAELALIGAVTARPSTAVALVLDETLVYRMHPSATEYDMLADIAGATYTLGGDHDTGSLAYHFDASMLGGARYELAHVAEAGYRHRLGGGYAAGARYTFAARSYASADYAGYSGYTHTGTLELAWGTPRTPAEVAAGYVIERELTDDAMLSQTGNGARGALRVRTSPSSELRASGTALYRSYPGRQDVNVTGDVGLYIDLSRVLGLVLGGTVARNVSSDGGFDYAKWTVFAGLIIATAS